PYSVIFFFQHYDAHLHLHSFPTRRSSDLKLDACSFAHLRPSSARSKGRARPRSTLSRRAQVRAVPPGSSGSRRRVPSRAALSVRSEGTRLNSSHLVISYAVFCLKKKKKD